MFPIMTLFVYRICAPPYSSFLLQPETSKDLMRTNLTHDKNLNDAQFPLAFKVYSPVMCITKDASTAKWNGCIMKYVE